MALPALAVVPKDESLVLKELVDVLLLKDLNEMVVRRRLYAPLALVELANLCCVGLHLVLYLLGGLHDLIFKGFGLLDLLVLGFGINLLSDVVAVNAAIWSELLDYLEW